MATMTSRKRVITAFNHVEPDHVPAWCGSSPEFWEKAKNQLGLDDEDLSLRLGDDFRRVWARYIGSDTPLSAKASYRTVFGIDRKGIGYGQPVNHPLAQATLNEVEDYGWPDPARTDPTGIRADVEKYGGQYAILGGDWSPFWHDLIDLLGMENMYLKMHDDPELVDLILTHVVDYYVATNTRILDAAADTIDILFIGNDFGSQTGPLLGEGLFRRFVLPHLKRLTDLGHHYGLKVMLHCCGGIAPLIPMMIEIGLDGIHAIQPSCQGMNLAKLKKDYGDKILLNGGIDSHHILIEGTPKLVRKKTREVLEIMMPGGGYVAAASHDCILEETPLENVLAMFDTIREYGGYH